MIQKSIEDPQAKMTLKKQPFAVFFKIVVVFRNQAENTGKYLYQIYFFNKVADIIEHLWANASRVTFFSAIIAVNLLIFHFNALQLVLFIYTPWKHDFESVMKVQIHSPFVHHFVHMIATWG